mmetsp:Transcript_13248/g.18759  ORF Transcript_13248/g.18759 Transcript_13248/m.18759 type:complete len:290 (-) Transcript_13248:734-1603(-)
MVQSRNLMLSCVFVATILTVNTNAWSTSLPRNVAIVPTSRAVSTTLYGERIGANGANELAVKNAEREKTAGRKGTKKFVDPTKLFLGNLPFDATEEDVWQFFKEHLGHTTNVRTVKIIRDWKTGKSKGYGFCLMANAMFATTAMEFCKGKKIKGRIVRIDQGKKKLDESQLYLKKKNKKAQTAEEQAIEAGMEEASLDDSEHEEYDPVALAEMLKDESDDAMLFADDDDDEDDDDFEFDGVFEEEYPEQYEPLTEEEEKMNRQQRRDAASRKKRRKLPHKGFESQPQWE